LQNVFHVNFWYTLWRKSRRYGFPTLSLSSIFLGLWSYRWWRNQASSTIDSCLDSTWVFLGQSILLSPMRPFVAALLATLPAQVLAHALMRSRCPPWTGGSKIDGSLSSVPILTSREPTTTMTPRKVLFLSPLLMSLP
jgi:hypothetical protein